MTVNYRRCNFAPARYADRIFWHNGNGSAAMSDLILEPVPGHSPRISGFVFLYPDASVLGLVLYNPKTKVTTWWYIHETIRDLEGETTHWILKPTRETVRVAPATAQSEITIWND